MAGEKLTYRKIMLGIYLEPKHLDFVNGLVVSGRVKSRGEFFRKAMNVLLQDKTLTKRVVEETA